MLRHSPRTTRTYPPFPYTTLFRACLQQHIPALRDFGYRFTGSSDLYEASSRRPSASVNFVTAHDGFTLADLVSYDHKHNEANLEDGRDGTDDNRSWNHGVEGPTDDPAIADVRRRQAKKDRKSTRLNSSH